MMIKKYVGVIVGLSVISAILLATSAGASSDASNQHVPTAICEDGAISAVPNVFAAIGVAGEVSIGPVGQVVIGWIGCDPRLTAFQGNTDTVFDH